jgi:hypothetical protein
MEARGIWESLGKVRSQAEAVRSEAIRCHKLKAHMPPLATRPIRQAKRWIVPGFFGLPSNTMRHAAEAFPEDGPVDGVAQGRSQNPGEHHGD